MTRKGLALGAGLSLAVTGLVAPAAHAVDPITTVETTGTGYAVTVADNFEVTARITNDALNGGNETLKFRIVDADAKLTAAAIDDNDLNNGGAADGLVDANDTGYIAQANFTDNVAIVNTGAAVAGTAYELMLDPSAAADAFSVTVQAWVDFDGDNVIDTAAGSEEVAGPIRTVTFYPAGDITWSTSLKAAPALGDAALTATVTSSPALNFDAMATGPTVAFGTYTAATNTITAIANSTAGAGANNAFTAGIAANADDEYEQAVAVTNATYVIQTMLGANPQGQRVYYTVADSDANDITAAAVVDDANNDGTEDVRLNSSVTVSATVDDTAGNGGDPVAGAVVTFTIDDLAAFTADGVVTAGGKTLEDGGDAITVQATTDADGVASVTLSTAGFTAADDQVRVTATVADVASAGNLDLDFVATASANIYNHNVLGTGGILKVAEGSTYTLTYNVADNFGELLADTDYRVHLNDGGNVTKTAALSSGIVSFSVTDDADVAETWTAKVQTYNSNTAAWDDVAGAGNSVAITPTVGASNAAGATTVALAQSWVTNNTGTGLALNLSALSSSDTRLGQSAPTTTTAADNAAGNVGTLSGVLTDAAGAATYGSVTLSAPGVMFKTGTVTSDGSITVQTSAAGAWGGVTLHSNTSGKVTVTATSGAASKTLEVTFAAAAETTATSVTVDIANAEKGKTMTVSGVVTDKWGNTIDNSNGDLTITYTGPGFINGALPTETDANGEYSFQVLIGANDTISGSVKVVLDGDSDGDNTDAETVTVEKDLAPAAAADTKVNAGSFKGYVAIYAKGHMGKRLSAKVGNDWVVVPALASNFVRVVEYTGAGYTINVRIYIDRVLVDTIVVTTK